MKYNSELEEGEACRDQDDGNNMDPEASLSYIDEKLHNVLGHLRKHFEGHPSADGFGEKFEGHGSFLTMNGSSSPLQSHPKRQRNYGTQESQKSKHTEGPSDKKAPRNASIVGRAGNASSSVQEVSGTRLAAGNAPLQNSSQLAQVASNHKLKDGSLNKSVVATDQRSLKFRFKMSQDNKSKTNTALYSGLGLNNTPSTYLGNSPGKTGGLVASSLEITNDSPTSILQVMTSFSIPGGAIVSPLHDGLLSLLMSEDDGPSMNKKGTSFFNGSQGKFVPLSSESALVVGTLSKNNNTNPMGKSKRSLEKKNASTFILEGGNRSLSKKRFGGKEMLSKDLKVNFLDFSETNVREVDRYGAVDKLYSSASVKQDSLESISGSGMNSEPDPQSSVEKCQNNIAGNTSKDVMIDSWKNLRSNNRMSLPHVKLKDISKDEASRKNPSCKLGDVEMEFKKEKILSTGMKKLKCSKSSGQAAVSGKEILRPDLGATANETDNYVIDHHISTQNSRPNKLMSEKDDWAHSSVRRSAKQPKYCSLSASKKEAIRFDNLKEIISDLKVDDQASAVSLKAAPLTVPTNTGDALASEAVTDAVVIDENWVQCDACQKWRLLPYCTKTEELPEKWVCSMLDWLPQMNQCDISEDDTTKAVNECYLPPTMSKKRQQDVVNGSASMVTSAHLRHVAQTSCNLNSEGVAVQAKKKYGSKEVHKSDGTNGLSQISGTSKDIPRESVKSRSLNAMAHVPVESNGLKKFGFRQDEQHKMRGSKKINTGDAYSDERRQYFNLDLQRASQNVHVNLQMASVSMNKQNEFADFERDTKERIVSSVKQHLQITQNLSCHGLVDVTMFDKNNSPTRKRKLDDLQDRQTDVHVKVDSSGSGFRRGKARFSKHGMQYSGGDFPNRKNRADSAGGSAEVKSVDEANQLKKQKCKSSFRQSCDALDTRNRDLGSRQVVTAANSSSSKISGSHKTRVDIKELKGSPVESVSSSPMRTSYHEKLASAAGVIVASDDAANGGALVTSNSRCSDGGGHDLISSGLVKKEKSDSDSNTRSHKFSVVDFMDRNAEQNVDGKAKASDIGKSNIFPNDTETIKQKERLRNQNAFGHCQDDGRANIELHVNPSFLHKMGKGHASQTKDNSKSSEGKKVKAREQPDEREYLNGKKGNILEMSKAIHNKREKCDARRDSRGQKSSGSRMANVRDQNKPDTKLVAQFCINGNASPLQNPIKDSGGERIHAEAAGSKHKSASDEVQNKQESWYYPTAQEPSQRVLLKEFPVKASRNRDVLNVTNEHGNAGRKSVARSHLTDVHLVGPDLSAQNPGPYISRPSTGALTKGKELRELADNLKDSGFSFESNEAYFKSALEFLRGASLSETCTGEGGKHGDISPMQAYSIASKLCENCALEYEKRKELAASSLAYKCMEVAYMRVVYCKNPTSSRDRSELQATLKASQGESPSSSASDVDNLNHQAPVDKNTTTNVSGTHIVARKRPNFTRLLDFMDDVVSAMEASKKSKKAFEAASSSLTEAENKEYITSIKRVIDFSFQDVEGLIRLVQQALEAISRSDLGGCR